MIGSLFTNFPECISQTSSILTAGTPLGSAVRTTVGSGCTLLHAADSAESKQWSRSVLCWTNYVMTQYLNHPSIVFCIVCSVKKVFISDIYADTFMSEIDKSLRL